MGSTCFTRAQKYELRKDEQRPIHVIKGARQRHPLTRHHFEQRRSHQPKEGLLVLRILHVVLSRRASSGRGPVPTCPIPSSAVPRGSCPTAQPHSPSRRPRSPPPLCRGCTPRLRWLGVASGLRRFAGWPVLPAGPIGVSGGVSAAVAPVAPVMVTSRAKEQDGSLSASTRAHACRMTEWQTPWCSHKRSTAAADSRALPPTRARLIAPLCRGSSPPPPRLDARHPFSAPTRQAACQRCPPPLLASDPAEASITSHRCANTYFWMDASPM